MYTDLNIHKATIDVTKLYICMVITIKKTYSFIVHMRCLLVGMNIFDIFHLQQFAFLPLADNGYHICNLTLYISSTQMSLLIESDRKVQIQTNRLVNQ